MREKWIVLAIALALTAGLMLACCGCGIVSWAGRTVGILPDPDPVDTVEKVGGLAGRVFRYDLAIGFAAVGAIAVGACLWYAPVRPVAPIIACIFAGIITCLYVLQYLWQILFGLAVIVALVALFMWLRRTRMFKELVLNIQAIRDGDAAFKEQMNKGMAGTSKATCNLVKQVKNTKGAEK